MNVAFCLSQRRCSSIERWAPLIFASVLPTWQPFVHASAELLIESCGRRGALEESNIRLVRLVARRSNRRRSWLRATRICSSRLCRLRALIALEAKPVPPPSSSRLRLAQTALVCISSGIYRSFRLRGGSVRSAVIPCPNARPVVVSVSSVRVPAKVNSHEQSVGMSRRSSRQFSLRSARQDQTQTKTRSVSANRLQLNHKYHPHRHISPIEFHLLGSVNFIAISS